MRSDVRYYLALDAHSGTVTRYACMVLPRSCVQMQRAVMDPPSTVLQWGAPFNRHALENFRLTGRA